MTDKPYNIVLVYGNEKEKFIQDMKDGFNKGVFSCNEITSNEEDIRKRCSYLIEQISNSKMFEMVIIGITTPLEVLIFKDKYGHDRVDVYQLFRYYQLYRDSTKDLPYTLIDYKYDLDEKKYYKTKGQIII